MKYEKIYLKDITTRKVENEPYVEIFLCEESPEVNNLKLPLIVVPGGGYNMCSFREAEPIALRYMSEGFNCFVLNYTCNVKYSTPHRELAILFEYIKNNAEKFNIDKEHISLVGFSAGGHLVSSYGFLYKEFEKEFSLEKDFLKPYYLILGYPVTSLILGTDSNTRAVISNNEEELVKKLTVPENVDETYPITYIWTTKTDACVPKEHSIMLNEALNAKNVPNKLRMFDSGVHGGSLCNHAVYPDDFNFKEIAPNRSWINESVDYIYSFLKK